MFNLNHSDIKLIGDADIDYLIEMLFDENGQLKVYSYEDLKDIPHDHIRLFCLRNGIYSLPTIELMDFLKEEIGDKLNQTIEIGAGNGVYSRELGIKGTDSYMQEEASIKAYYDLYEQTPVSYGDHVEKIDALSAVKKYKPKIVLASWCTHKYNPKEHWRGGNALGISERNIFDRVEKYIHIGNETVHDKKPILRTPHRKIKEKWIMSRAESKDRNIIYIWEK